MDAHAGPAALALGPEPALGPGLAPAGFGQFGGDLLVGNFGDGHINVYDPRRARTAPCRRERPYLP